MIGKAADKAKDINWLMVLAGMGLGVIAAIAWGAIHKSLPNDSQTLLGVIVGGLFTTIKDITQIIRSLWQDDSVSKITDHLATTAPVVAEPVPKSAADGARQAADAAVQSAEDIEDQVRAANSASGVENKVAP